MKTNTRSLFELKANEQTIAELVEVLIGQPSRVVGHAIIENGDTDSAKVFGEYEDALEAFCDRFNVERSLVTKSSYWTHVHAFPESDDEEIQSFYNDLITFGFEIEHTGGGCTWWVKHFLDGHYIAVTQEANKEIYREHMEDLGISVGLYWGDDCEGEYFLSHTVEGAKRLVEVLDTLKLSRMFDIVSQNGFNINLKEQ